MQKGQDSGKLEPDSNGWRQGFGGGRLDDVRAITIDYKIKHRILVEIPTLERAFDIVQSK